MPIQVVPCEVLSVDTDNFTCDLDPIGDGAKMLGVRLKSAVNDNGFGHVVFPKVGTTVLASLINNRPESAYVLTVDEPESVLVKTGSGGCVELKNDGKVYLNGDSLGGLIKIDELVSRMNSVESAFNELQNVFNAHVHPTPSGPSSVTGTLSTSSAGNTTKQQLENPKVNHG